MEQSKFESIAQYIPKPVREKIGRGALVAAIGCSLLTTACTGGEEAPEPTIAPTVEAIPVVPTEELDCQIINKESLLEIDPSCEIGPS